MRVVAVDPGKATGLAMADGQDGEYELEAFELPASEAMRWLHERLETVVPDHVVVEGITLTSKSAMKPDVKLALELIGVVKYLCWCYGAPCVVQFPGDRKFATDTKLKALDWYRSYPHDHPREATRHLVARLDDLDAAFSLRLARMI